MSAPTPTRTNVKEKAHQEKSEAITLKRRGVTEQIRKSSRLDHVGKRRYGMERKEMEEEEEQVSPESLAALTTLLQQYTTAHSNAADLSTFLPLLTSIHPYLIHDPCIHLIITSGVMNIWMIHIHNQILQHAIFICLADIASSTSTRLTSHLHIFLPFLTSQLTSSITSQQYQSIIDICNILGNLLAEDLHLRITLLSQDILTSLLHLLHAQMDIDILRIVTFMISNLVKLHPSYHHDLRDTCQTQLSRILSTPLISRILTLITHPHIDIQSECMWILATLSSISSQVPSQLVASHFISLTSSHWSQPDLILIPLIRIIGIFASGSSEMVDAIITHDILHGLYHILIHTEHRGLRKEVIYAIADIAQGGKKEHVDALLASNFLSPLIQYFLTSPYDIRCECAHALYHIARISPDYLMLIMNHDSIRIQCTEHSHPIIGMYLSLLTAHVDTVIASLSMIELILQSYPNGRTLIEEMDGITAMEQLQVSENRHLYVRVCDIIDKYFSQEEEGLDVEAEREGEYPVWRSQGNGPIPPQRPQPPSREPAPPSQFAFSSSPSPSTPFEF